MKSYVSTLTRAHYIPLHPPLLKKYNETFIKKYFIDKHAHSLYSNCRKYDIIENALGIVPEPHYFNIPSTFVHKRRISTTTSKDT
jgi:hypothetical protein